MSRDHTSAPPKPVAVEPAPAVYDELPVHTERVGPPCPDALLTVHDVADLLGKKEPFVYRLTHERRITHYKIGKELRFKRSHVDAFIESNRIRAIRHEAPRRSRGPMSTPRRRTA